MFCYSEEIVDTRKENRTGEGQREKVSTIALMFYVLEKERLEANKA